MIEQSVKQRLIEFLAYKKIGQGKFEKMVGISNGYISKIKSNPSSTILNKILATFPEINQIWLLTGEGNMILTENTTANPSVTDTVEEVNKVLLSTEQESVIAELRKQITEKDKEIAFLRSLVTNLTQAPELPRVSNPATDMGIKYYEEMMREIKSVKDEIKKTI